MARASHAGAQAVAGVQRRSDPADLRARSGLDHLGSALVVDARAEATVVR
jgi:hypothetical protein